MRTPKHINLTLNSNYSLSLSAATNPNELSYYVDWGSLGFNRNKKYKMHFTYIGGANNYTGAKIAMLYIDALNINAYYNVDGTTALMSGSKQTTFVGFLKPIVLVGSSSTAYLQAEDNTNVPVELISIPTSNRFTVTIRDNSGALYTDTASAVLADYILNLSFVEVDEPED